VGGGVRADSRAPERSKISKTRTPQERERAGSGAGGQVRRADVVCNLHCVVCLVGLGEPSNLLDSTGGRSDTARYRRRYGYAPASWLAQGSLVPSAVACV